MLRWPWACCWCCMRTPRVVGQRWRRNSHNRHSSSSSSRSRHPDSGCWKQTAAPNPQGRHPLRVAGVPDEHGDGARWRRCHVHAWIRTTRRPDAHTASASAALWSTPHVRWFRLSWTSRPPTLPPLAAASRLVWCPTARVNGHAWMCESMRPNQQTQQHQPQRRLQKQQLLWLGVRATPVYSSENRSTSTWPSAQGLCGSKSVCSSLAML